MTACGDQVASNDLVVYSARKEHLIKPLFDQFTAETGIQVRYVTDAAGPLLTRLQAEGEQSQADILMTVDAGNLWQAAELGVLSPVESSILEKNVPSNLQDPENRWFALTIRARTIVYATDRVKPEEMSTYEALADKTWAGRVCLRTSKKVYNQSLVATMIAALGEQVVEKVVTGWVENLALQPFSNDTKVMEAIAVGQCDVGIVNSYYYGRLMKQRPELKLALFWPNQFGDQSTGRGVHVNVSAAGITRVSHKKEQAIKLLEWLSEPKAQQLLMELNQEYPVNPTIKYLPEIASWGEFKADSINVSEAGRLQTAAVKLMDRSGYR
ncbi:MAG: extracellular solute-binding protein [Spongiibacteraceae bacterium]|nr:extracellular solute-binding protein [Spongiibacteraceae bacterium]